MAHQVNRFMGCDYNIEGFWRVMKERIGAGRCVPDLHPLYQRTRHARMAHHERPLCVALVAYSASNLVGAPNWVSQVSKMLHEGVIYRHSILTVPAMFRTIFSHTAGLWLSGLMRCGVQYLDDFLSEVRGKTLRGGPIVVIHTHGRHG